MADKSPRALDPSSKLFHLPPPQLGNGDGIATAQRYEGQERGRNCPQRLIFYEGESGINNLDVGQSLMMLHTTSSLAVTPARRHHHARSRGTASTRSSAQWFGGCLRHVQTQPSHAGERRRALPGFTRLINAPSAVDNDSARKWDPWSVDCCEGVVAMTASTPDVSVRPQDFSPLF